MRRHLILGAAMAAIGLTLFGAVLRPAGAAPTAPGRAKAATVARHGAQMRRYDTLLLAHANRVRASHNRHRMLLSPKLERVAHRYAAHLARTGRLQHNPSLNAEVSTRCPHWTAVGENIAVAAGGESTVGKLFSDYMHSPPHRRNILDGMYRDVGIATVQVTHDGQVERWNVMDFGDHCK